MADINVTLNLDLLPNLLSDDGDVSRNDICPLNREKPVTWKPSERQCPLP